MIKLNNILGKMFTRGTNQDLLWSYYTALLSEGNVEEFSDHHVMSVDNTLDLKYVAAAMSMIKEHDQFTKNYLIEIDYNFNYGPKQNGLIQEEIISEDVVYQTVLTNRLDIITFNKIIYNTIDPTYRVGHIIVVLNTHARQVDVANLLSKLPMRTILVTKEINNNLNYI